MFNLPLHKRSKLLSAHLIESLREKYGIKSLRVRKGDSVRIMRGEYKGIEGKVTAVYPKSQRIAVEGVTREKASGDTVPIKIHASKVMITSLNLDDPFRRGMLEVLEKRAKGG